MKNRIIAVIVAFVCIFSGFSTFSAEAETGYTALKLNEPAAFINGVKKSIDSTNQSVTPFEENGRTLVPLRFIGESLGTNVFWADAANTAIITLGEKNV